MIGNEIYDYFHSGIVGTCYKGFKLRHSVWYVGGEVGVYVVIVADGIRRAGLALDDIFVVGPYAVPAVIGLCSMFDDTGVPDVRNAQ